MLLLRPMMSTSLAVLPMTIEDIKLPSSSGLYSPGLMPSTEIGALIGLNGLTES